MKAIPIFPNPRNTSGTPTPHIQGKSMDKNLAKHGRNCPPRREDRQFLAILAPKRLPDAVGSECTKIRQISVVPLPGNSYNLLRQEDVQFLFERESLANGDFVWQRKTGKNDPRRRKSLRYLLCSEKSPANGDARFFSARKVGSLWVRTGFKF